MREPVAFRRGDVLWIDTNILSEISKPAPDAGILKRFQRHDLHVATASLVWSELLFGCQRLPSSRRRDLLLAKDFRFFDGLVVEDWRS